MVDHDLDEPVLVSSAARPLARPGPPADWRELSRAWLGERRWGAVAAVGLLVVGAVVAGYVLLRTPPAPPIETRLPMAGDVGTAGAGGGGSGGGGSGGGIGDGAVAGASTSSTVPATFVVHAAGAVAVPGVHRVPAGSRVADLLAAAGGPTGDADLDRVNLAAVLADGERVWFARVGEEAPPSIANGSGSGSGGSGAPAGSDGGVAAGGGGPVDVNQASVDELDALPGIGPAIAAAIVEHRERHGPFRSVDALLDVPGIGDAKLAQLRDLVTV